MASLATKRKSRDNDDAYSQDKTPANSPPRKKPRITRSQKQALMDNLQLEITERARKLRAQYALQAQDLRARIERRINRIPVALRKAKMGELLEKQTASLRAQHENSSPKKYRSPTKGSRNSTAISRTSGMKKAATVSPSPLRVRKHSPAGIYSDKENAPASGEQLDVLKNPKTRAKPGAAAGTSRVVSQEVRGADYRILSPKSSNSRTYPQSPLRASPEKGQASSYLARTISPLKPSSPLKSTSANADHARPSSRATTTSSRDNRPPSQAKRPVSRATTAPRSIRSPLSRPATRQAERRGSTSSSTSSGTSIANSAKIGGPGSRKTTTTSSTSSTAKKMVAARSQAPSVSTKRNPVPAARKATGPAAGESTTTTGGRRVLRKRA